MTENIAERIARLSPISIAKLEQELGFANSTIRKWAKSSPSADKLLKVADHLGVSVDVLLGHQVQEKRSSLMERPAYEIAEKFVSEFGSLLSEKNFIDFTKLYNVMNENQKTFLLARTIGMLNGQGINTQAIVGY